MINSTKKLKIFIYNNKQNKNIIKTVKKDDVLLKMNNQWPDQKKIPLADYVFENSSVSGLSINAYLVFTSLRAILFAFP